MSDGKHTTNGDWPGIEPWFMKTMKQQRVEIEEVIETINDNINQFRSDLEICLPELTGSLHGLMEEYFLDIKLETSWVRTTL